MGAPTIIDQNTMSDDWPCHYAKDRQNVIYITNGYQRHRLWDGVTEEALQSGIKPPHFPGVDDDTTAGSVSASETYYCGLKYIDYLGRESELSELTDVATDASGSHRIDWTSIDPSEETDRVRYVDLYRSTAGQLTTVYKVVRLGNHGDITATADNGGFVEFTLPLGHSLVAGAVILVAGHSVAGYNTTHQVTTATTTTVVTSVAYSSAGTGTATWTINGYLDEDDLSDTALALNTALPILNTDNSKNARRQGMPPSECAVAAWFQDRMFYAVQRKYDSGTVETTAGSQTITLTGGTWIEEFGGSDMYPAREGEWLMQIEGEPKPIRIVDWLNASQMRATEDTVPTLTQSGASYVLYPDPKIFRNRIIYCVDDSTEILTKRGWLRRHELVPLVDEAMTINPYTMEIEWNDIQRVNEQQYSGDMHRWKNVKFDALTTSDHRWLAVGSGINGGWHGYRTSATHFTTTAECESMTTKRLIVDGGHYPGAPSQVFSDEFVELVGWYVTEGHQSGRCSVIIVQSESHNPAYTQRIRALQHHFKSNGATATECKSSRDDLMRSFYFGLGIGDELIRVCPGKQLTQEFLLSLTRTQLELLYRTMMDGDGHVVKKGGTEIFAQKDRGRIDSFQVLCCLLGKRSGARLSKYFDCHGVTIYQPRYLASMKIKPAIEHYTGVVWCPTTQNGTWMARRNGFTFWTGNSEVDEAESVVYDAAIAEDNNVGGGGYINAIGIQENTGDDDEITGLMPYGFALWVLKERHLYRITFSKQPNLEAGVIMVASRGCLNQRSWVMHDGLAYLMDSSGIYAFDTNSVEPISMPIQNLWRERTIDLSKAKWFFAGVDPNEEVVRFYVSFVGDTEDRPTRALCYHVRFKGWWVESYPWQLGGATKADIESSERLLVGGTEDAVYVSGEGFTDNGTTISYAWRSGKFSLPSNANQQSRALEVAFQPTQVAATLNANLYYGNESSPLVFDIDQNMGNGIQISANSADIAISMAADALGDEEDQPGWVRQEFGGRGGKLAMVSRWLSVALSGDAPSTEQAIVYQIVLVGVEGR